MFSVTDLDAATARLQSLDIHPTAPLWGERSDRKLSATDNDGENAELASLEEAAMMPYQALKKGLEDARVEYQRRAIRLVLRELEWKYDQGDLCLSFELHRGQFATSVLRELVREAA